MGDKSYDILDEYHFSNASLVILQINLEDSPIGYKAIMIEDEVFLFFYDYVKAPGHIQIDTKDSKQKNFTGKKLIFLPAGDKRIINPIRMYNCMYY